MTPAVERSWDAALREELERRDPRLLAVYEVYADVYHRDCTARQITRHLAGLHGAFAPSEDTVGRLLNKCRALESDFAA